MSAERYGVWYSVPDLGSDVLGFLMPFQIQCRPCSFSSGSHSTAPSTVCYSKLTVLCLHVVVRQNSCKALRHGQPCNMRIQTAKLFLILCGLQLWDQFPRLKTSPGPICVLIEILPSTFWFKTFIHVVDALLIVMGFLPKTHIFCTNRQQVGFDVDESSLPKGTYL